MLNSRRYAVLTAVLSAVGVLPLNAKANVSFPKYGEELIYTLHTHLYSPSSGLSSSDEIKLASVCFINDTSACSDGLFSNGEDLSHNSSGGGGSPDYDLNPEERCKNDGFIYGSCPDGQELGGKRCPYGNYYSECVEACPSSYVECKEPYYGVGETCDGKYASCQCDPCSEGYDYTEIPEGYIQDGESCLDCDGQTKYKIKINPCDGFQDCGSMGGDTGAETCLSGTITKYDNCKPCPNLGKYASCPQGMNCEYEECSGLWYMTNCQANYTYYCGYCPTY